MPLVRHGEVIEESWVELDLEARFPQGADVIVPFARLEAEADALRTHPGRIAVVVPNDQDVFALKPHLDALDMIVLLFPAMADGRAFSQARRIRTALGFAGELRARGRAVPDQVAFLRQVGFDSFELDDRFDIDVVRRLATSMSLTYQRGYQPGRGFAPADVFEARAAARHGEDQDKPDQEPARAAGGA